MSREYYGFDDDDFAIPQREPAMTPTKKRSMAALIVLASINEKGFLLKQTTADAMYEAVVYHRRWYRRFWNWLMIRVNQ